MPREKGIHHLRHDSVFVSHHAVEKRTAPCDPGEEVRSQLIFYGSKSPISGTPWWRSAPQFRGIARTIGSPLRCFRNIVGGALANLSCSRHTGRGCTLISGEAFDRPRILDVNLTRNFWAAHYAPRDRAGPALIRWPLSMEINTISASHSRSCSRSGGMHQEDEARRYRAAMHRRLPQWPRAEDDGSTASRGPREKVPRPRSTSSGVARKARLPSPPFSCAAICTCVPPSHLGAAWYPAQPRVYHRHATPPWRGDIATLLTSRRRARASTSSHSGGWPHHEMQTRRKRFT